MSEQDVHEAVTERLADGWVPSRSQERTWVRGARFEREGDDLIERWDDGTERAAMTEAEETDLLGRSYARDDADSELDLIEVEDIGASPEGTDG